MPVTITSNTPLEIFGAPFTGLMFLSPGAGQTEWCSGCCPAGDCYAIAFVDGMYQGGYIKGAGQCPAEFTQRAPDFLEPSTSGSYYNLGYRWGDPDDLLSNLGHDGCCASMALLLPPGPVDFSEFGDYTEERRAYRADMTALENTVDAQGDLINDLSNQVGEQSNTIALLNADIARLEVDLANCTDINTVLTAQIELLEEQCSDGDTGDDTGSTGGNTGDGTDGNTGEDTSTDSTADVAQALEAIAARAKAVAYVKTESDCDTCVPLCCDKPMLGR